MIVTVDQDRSVEYSWSRKIDQIGRNVIDKHPDTMTYYTDWLQEEVFSHYRS